MDSGKKVAIKIISKQSLDDMKKTQNDSEKETAIKKIEREIVLMRLVKHPNIMQLYDVYESDTDL
jgi:serine/threonine protein kinase